MYRALNALWVLALLSWGGTLCAADVPSRDVDLTEFGRFEVKATGFAENQQTAFGASEVATQIENILRSKVKEWNTQPVPRGARTLNIQPFIERIRLKGGSPLPRNSLVTLQLRLTDGASGELIAEPEFSGQANGLTATLTHGRADNEMLTRVARDASDYLDRSYQTAVATVIQRRAEALAKRRDLAENGDVSSQVSLGLMYSLGQEVEQDHAQAAAWWRKAAEQGDASAEIYLGEAYATGRGVPADDAQAAAWYKKAADQGNTRAQCALASMYETGRGVPRDEKVAVAWYQKAADKGDVAAKKYLVRKSRATTTFNSFEDAARMLEPDPGYDVQLVMDPMALREKILVLRLRVLQVIGDNELLMTSVFGEQLPGSGVFYAFLPANYAGRRDFVDGQDVAVVGEVVGTYQYAANSGARKTVPKMRVYGIRSGYP
jgi:hypothetical protein